MLRDTIDNSLTGKVFFTDAKARENVVQGILSAILSNHICCTGDTIIVNRDSIVGGWIEQTTNESIRVNKECEDLRVQLSKCLDDYKRVEAHRNDLLDRATAREHKLELDLAALKTSFDKLYKENLKLSLDRDRMKRDLDNVNNTSNMFAKDLKAQGDTIKKLIIERDNLATDLASSRHAVIQNSDLYRKSYDNIMKEHADEIKRLNDKHAQEIKDLKDSRSVTIIQEAPALQKKIDELTAYLNDYKDRYVLISSELSSAYSETRKVKDDLANLQATYDALLTHSKQREGSLFDSNKTLREKIESCEAIIDELRDKIKNQGCWNSSIVYNLAVTVA